jgi:hypothetical protein
MTSEAEKGPAPEPATECVKPPYVPDWDTLRKVAKELVPSDTGIKGVQTVREYLETTLYILDTAAKQSETLSAEDVECIEDNRNILELVAMWQFHNFLKLMETEGPSGHLFTTPDILLIARCLTTTTVHQEVLMPDKTLAAMKFMETLDLDNEQLCIALLWCWTPLNSHCTHWKNAAAEPRYVAALMRVCNSAMFHLAAATERRSENPFLSSLLKNTPRIRRLVALVGEATIAAEAVIPREVPTSPTHFCAFAKELCVVAREAAMYAHSTCYMPVDTAYLIFRQLYNMFTRCMSKEEMAWVLKLAVNMRMLLAMCVSRPHACFEEEFQVVSMVVDLATRCGGISKAVSEMATACLYAFANRPAGYLGLTNGEVPPPRFYVPTIESCTGCTYQKFWTDLFRLVDVAHPDEVCTIVNGLVDTLTGPGSGMLEGPAPVSINMETAFNTVGEEEWFAGPARLVARFYENPALTIRGGPGFSALINSLSLIFEIGVSMMFSYADSHPVGENRFAVLGQAIAWHEQETEFNVALKATLFPRLTILQQSWRLSTTGNSTNSNQAKLLRQLTTMMTKHVAKYIEYHVSGLHGVF